MQKLVTLAAVAMLLTQVVLLCLQREANTWTFSLVTRAVAEPATAWTAIDTLFVQHNRALDSSNNTLPSNVREDLSPEVASCLQDAWRTYRAHVPVHCAVRVHNGFKLREVLAAFNPHLLLLSLCCVHVTCCLRRSMPESKNVMRGIILAMGCLSVGMGLYQNSQTSNGFQYPTIVGMLLCFAVCFYYVQMAPADAKEDPYWEIVFHLQAVGAPLVTLVFAAMGVRFWDDALYHLFSLLAACNCLWLQRVAVKTELSKILCAVVTIGLTTSSLLLMRHQLQADANVEQWQPMVAHMSLVVVVPLYVMAWTRANVPKFPLHLTQLCVSAALLATIFNLAMF